MFVSIHYAKLVRKIFLTKFLITLIYITLQSLFFLCGIFDLMMCWFYDVLILKVIPIIWNFVYLRFCGIKYVKKTLPKFNTTTKSIHYISEILNRKTNIYRKLQSNIKNLMSDIWFLKSIVLFLTFVCKRIPINVTRCEHGSCYNDKQSDTADE